MVQRRRWWGAVVRASGALSGAGGGAQRCRWWGAGCAGLHPAGLHPAPCRLHPAPCRTAPCTLPTAPQIGTFSITFGPNITLNVPLFGAQSTGCRVQSAPDHCTLRTLPLHPTHPAVAPYAPCDCALRTLRTLRLHPVHPRPYHCTSRTLPCTLRTPWQPIPHHSPALPREHTYRNHAPHCS